MKELTDIRVTACIVTYNNGEQVIDTIKSILQNTQGVFLQLYVSDNGSADNTVEMVRKHFPEVCVVENHHNGGFGWGHNQVISQIDSDYHAIINPDIHLTEDSLSKLTAFLEQNPDIVMCCPKIMNEDSTEQYLPKKYPKIRYLLGGRLERFGGIFKKWRDEYTLRNQSLPDIADIEFCTGCFMFARTALLKEVGGFDDRYFMYFEDADLTRTLLKKGRVVRTTVTSVVHMWERASAKSFKFLKIQVHSMFQYFKKWK